VIFFPFLGYFEWAVDIIILFKGYFDVGRTLYNEDPKSSKLRFRQADMLDSNFATKYPDLKNRFHFVHSANVIHLFGVAEQEVFFRNLVHLIKPGGTLWGRQVGLIEEFDASYRQPEGKGARFTVKEFGEMALRVGGWNEGDIQYDAQLVKYDEIRAQRKDKAWVLQWSVKTPAGKEKRMRHVAEATACARVFEVN
jgi:cyclopropane fatty-acyl-phospholipid synthase-like methyltransferase